MPKKKVTKTKPLADPPEKAAVKPEKRAENVQLVREKLPRTAEEVVAAALMHLAQNISGYFGLTGLAKELAKTAEAVHNGKV